MSCQLVRPAESFCAAGKRASMGLLARMRSDVSSLVLEPVKCLITQRTFVRPGQFCPLILHVIMLHGHRHRVHHSGEVAVIHGGKSFVILKRHGPVEGRRKSGLLRWWKLLLLRRKGREVG
jgi:hypothetical protein